MSDKQTSSVLVTVKQAADQLGMARSSLYRLCKNGKVPSYAAGGKGFGVRVDIQEAKTALRRLVQVNTEEKEPPRLEDDERECHDDDEEERELHDDDEDECELEVREMDAFDNMTRGEL